MAGAAMMVRLAINKASRKARSESAAANTDGSMERTLPHPRFGDCCRKRHLQNASCHVRTKREHTQGTRKPDADQDALAARGRGRARDRSGRSCASTATKKRAPSRHKFAMRAFD